MDSKVFQCCYTNAVRQSGATTTSGWQTVAVSPDLPRDAYSVCSKLQNANSTIQTVPEDENGDVLKLTEIYGDGSNIYVIRTSYGLIDRLKRPNMFSHAYIFSLREGPYAIQDPNIFLSLDSSNFKLSEEEAEAWDGKLSYLEPVTLDGAMERAGIDSEEYIQLLRCVYAQFSERKAPKPLYVQYDGTPENMRDILYCIYYGLPYNMRRSLNVASCTTDGDAAKNLVFSRRAREKSLYVDPATGENNILTPRIERRIERYGFIDHAARELPHQDFAGFFSELDRTTESLGDPTGQNELTVKLAYTLMCGSDVPHMSDGALETTLSDILRLKPTGDERVAGLVSRLVGEFDARGLGLSDENELTLNDWIASTGSATLRDAGTAHSISQLFSMTDDQAAGRLEQMSAETRDFYINAIRDRSRGQAILRAWLELRLGRPDNSWEELGAVLEDSGVMADPSGIRALVLEKAEKLYARGASGGSDPAAALDSYRGLVKPLVSPEDWNARRRAALENYWRGVSYNSFSMDKAEEYFAMACDDIPMSRAIVELAKVGAEYDPTDETGFFLALRRRLRSTAGPSSGGEKSRIVGLLKDMVASRYPEKTESFGRWVEWTANAETETVARSLVRLRAALSPFDPTEIISVLRDKEVVELSRRRSGGSGGGLLQAVERACLNNDSKEKPIPLDLWLLIGGARFSNGFDIFDSHDAFILSADPAATVRASTLMNQTKYQNLARDYVARKGEAYRSVKRWLSEAGDSRRDASSSTPRPGFKIFGKK